MAATASRRCKAAAAAPRLLLLMSALLLAAPAHAQEIRLVAGPGCADIPPSPPANLKAAALNGAVKLTWDKPNNGACVTEYQITVVALDTNQRSFLAPQRTPDFTVTIQGLQNGQRYRFFVKSFSARYNGGGEAQAVATPTPSCSTNLIPSAPTNLVATPGNANVTLCWGPPQNLGCVDEYRLLVRAVDQGNLRSSPSQSHRVNSGGCVTIQQLQNGQPYEFSVQAYSTSMRNGGYSSVQATPVAPPKQWACLPAPGFYPLCNAAFAGRCNPMSCAQQKAAGQCSAPFMRVVDPFSRSIIQYCSDVCGCSTNPQTGRSAAAGDEPLVQAFDEGATASDASAASATSQADMESRFMGLFPLPSNPADTACCQGPVRPGRRDFGVYMPTETMEGQADGMMTDDIVSSP